MAAPPPVDASVGAPASTADGTVSVHARLIGSAEPELWMEHDTAVHYAASTMKLPVLIAFERAVSAGTIDPDQRVEVDPTFASQVEGETFTMQESWDQDPRTWAVVGTALPARVLAHRMVVTSGNLATNLILGLVGPAAVADVLAAAGCSPATRLPRGIEDAPAREAGLDNLVTARDLALVVDALAAGRLGGPELVERVETTLRGQELRDGIPAGLPFGLEVGNKTGSVDGVNHDVALIRPPEGPALALAVLVTRDGTEAERTELIRSRTAAVWAAYRERVRP